MKKRIFLKRCIEAFLAKQGRLRYNNVTEETCEGGSAVAENERKSVVRVFGAHPGLLLRHSLVQLIPRLAGLSALYAGFVGVGQPFFSSLLWYALAGVVYAFVVLPLRFQGGEMLRQCCNLMPEAIGVIGAPQKKAKKYTTWLLASWLRFGRGLAWGLPFLASLGLFLYGMEYLPFNKLGQIVKAFALLSQSATTVQGMLVIGVLLLAFLLIFICGWQRDRAVEYVDVQSLSIRGTFARGKMLRKKAKGQMLRHNAIQVLWMIPGFFGVAAVLVPYVRENLRSGGDILTVLSRLLRLMKRPLPGMQMAYLTVALLLTYFPFRLLRRMRNAALIASLDEGDKHAAG